MVFFEWSIKLTKLSKGAYKSTFGKNNIYEKVLPLSALCTLQYHFGQLPRDHKKVCQKNNFHVIYVFCIFPTNLLRFSKVRSILFWTCFYHSQPSKGWKVSWIKVWTFSEKVKNQFSQSFLPLLCDRHWIENCIENHQIE